MYAHFAGLFATASEAHRLHGLVVMNKAKRWMPFLIGAALVACASEEPDAEPENDPASHPQESDAPLQSLQFPADVSSSDADGAIDKAASCWVTLQYCSKSGDNFAYCTKSSGCSCSRAVSACRSLIDENCSANIIGFDVKGCAP
jgi:hypothetical protein